MEEMETRITELKNIIREKEAVIEQLGGVEEQGARVENKATRDSVPDVAKQLANKNPLIDSLKETIKHLESMNNSLGRREDEFNTIEQKYAKLAEEYEKLRKEKNVPKKAEMKVMDTDRTYGALLKVMGEFMEDSCEVVEEDVESSVEKFKIIDKTLESALLNLESGAEVLGSKRKCL